MKLNTDEQAVMFECLRAAVILNAARSRVSAAQTVKDAAKLYTLFSNIVHEPTVIKTPESLNIDFSDEFNEMTNKVRNFFVNGNSEGRIVRKHDMSWEITYRANGRVRRIDKLVGEDHVRKTVRDDLEAMFK